MYLYDPIDQRLVEERVAQFRDQTRRHLAGELDVERYRPLRLQNGLYEQKQAPMLRVAIPYGLLSSAQLRYAALDVELLPELRDSMAASLREAGKTEIAQQEFDDMIPAGVPEGTRVANKTGWITRIQHDGAIVYLNGTEVFRANMPAAAGASTRWRDRARSCPTGQSWAGRSSAASPRTG